MLSGGVLGCDPEIVTFWSFGHNLLPQWRVLLREQRRQKWKVSVEVMYSVILGAGISLEGFSPPGKRGDRELCAGVQAVNTIYKKCRFSALPPSAWAKWASGWGGHLMSPNLGFSGFLLNDQAPRIWITSCAVSYLPAWAQKRRVKFLQSLTSLVCKLLFPLRIKLRCNCSFAL